MKKLFCTFFVGVVFIIQTSIGLAGQLSSSLEQYQEKTQALVDTEKDEKVKKYLNSCLSAASYLNGLEAGDARLSEAFEMLVQERIAATNALPSYPEGSPSGVQTEDGAYITYLFPYRKEEYIALIALQDQLLERKYFKTETAKNANFIEGVVNGYWSLTRADHSDVKKVLAQPHLGVSPWEAIFRLEPALAFNNGAKAAILGAAGLSYTFFPDITRSASPPTFHETFMSKYVKKTGGRFGVGVGQIDDKARLLLGAGVQLNAVGLWGLYEPDDQSYMLGISASDLSKLKKVISSF